MSIGDKIKKARTSKLNTLTQKALGYLVGLSDVRIRQYELNTRTPKEGVLQKISDSTGFSMQYFTDHFIETPIDAMHALFDLRQKYGLTIQKEIDENGMHSVENGRHVYTMTIQNRDLNSRVHEWIESIEKIKLHLQDNGNSSEKDIEDECLIWEGRYPISLAIQSEARLRELRKEQKSNREQNPSD